eukprot:scaffold10500_cov51-Prasinocladus_malaysianus.AAC.2
MQYCGRLVSQEDSRGHTWDTPGVTGSAWVEDGPELMGPRASSKPTSLASPEQPTASMRSDLHVSHERGVEHNSGKLAQPTPSTLPEQPRLASPEACIPESKEERKAKKRLRHEKEGKHKKHKHKDKDKRKEGHHHHKDKKARVESREETPSSVGTGGFKLRIGLGKKPASAPPPGQ